MLIDVYGMNSMLHRTLNVYKILTFTCSFIQRILWIISKFPLSFDPHSHI
jgi:hypothetical protein